MKIQVEVFWVVMPCGVVVGYQYFGGPWCLHLQGEVIFGFHRVKIQVVVFWLVMPCDVVLDSPEDKVSMGL
jgi:hypothetical protein